MESHKHNSLIVLPDESPVVFPCHSYVRSEGILCVGGNLDKQTLINAYENGIFPWYSEGQPIIWWSPEKRAIFECEKVHISKNMRKLIRNHQYEIVFDCDFVGVLDACADRGGDETWILPEVREAYSKLFREGVAHSVEVYRGACLVGGLYGVFVKNIFCGESMFSLESNTSKIALIYLSRFLLRNNCYLIDAQLENSHLIKLGVKTYSRSEFLKIFGELRDNKELLYRKWTTLNNCLGDM